MSVSDARDAAMRLGAVEQLRRRGIAGVLSSGDLAAGFIFEGVRVPLLNPQRGIFKPQAMRYVLSVRTVFPMTGRRIWYEDQRRVHEQIHEGDELVDYSFMVGGPEMAENRHLREAMLAGVPIIYFLGVAPARYAAVFPVYVADWSASEGKVQLAFGAPDAQGFAGSTAAPRLDYAAPSAPERRYGLRLVRQRLHQATFREAVLAAYGSRCAISNLPEPRLLDAAHIVADRQEDLGQPVVPNGLPLSKVHHAAFDAHLIGIDPDYRIHVSPHLLNINDGPMLEQGIKAMAGKTLHLPSRPADQPDRDRLAARFEQFRAML